MLAAVGATHRAALGSEKRHERHEGAKGMIRTCIDRLRAYRHLAMSCVRPSASPDLPRRHTVEPTLRDTGYGCYFYARAQGSTASVPCGLALARPFALRVLADSGTGGMLYKTINMNIKPTAYKNNKHEHQAAAGAGRGRRGVKGDILCV